MILVSVSALLPIHHQNRSLSQCDTTGKRNKRHKNQKERIILSLFTDDTTVCIENPKESTEKLTKVAGYKIKTIKPNEF